MYNYIYNYLYYIYIYITYILYVFLQKYRAPQTTLKSFESQEATATSQLSAGIRPAGLGGAKRCEAVVSPWEDDETSKGNGCSYGPMFNLCFLRVNLWLLMVNL